jgi:chromosomal replication initiation ATPase DnaA
MKIEFLADDLRYKNLLAKVQRLEARVEALENRPRVMRVPLKKNKQAAPRMAKMDNRFDEMAAICQPIADAYVMTLDELRGRVPMNSCPARIKAMQACVDAGFSLVTVGKFFDGRDHSTIMDAIGRRGQRYVKKGRQTLQSEAQNA